ncbi:MAG: hypothetical protein WAK60_00300 [Sedimentisphaerales bacterium]
MHYTELLRGVNSYASGNDSQANTFPNIHYVEEKIGDRSYSELIANKGTPPTLLPSNIEYLLSKWNWRVPINKKELKKAVEQVSDNVRTWDLAEMNLWEYHGEINRIFLHFINTGLSKKNYTGASKTLHCLNPRFFMMWDMEIRYGYGCCESEEGYFNFLLRCQKEIKEIISTYVHDYPSCPEISRRIYKGLPKSLLKLLDEYNIEKYTNKRI